MKFLRSKLVILVGVLVFVIGTGALVWFFVVSPGARAQQSPSTRVEGRSYVLEPFMTNLADEGSRRIIRVSVELLVTDGRAVKDVERAQSEVRSEILALLRSRYLADLEGERGMTRLAADIQDRVNTVLGHAGTLQVYFTDFIIQ